MKTSRSVLSALTALSVLTALGSGVLAGTPTSSVSPVIVSVGDSGFGALLGVWDGKRWLALPGAVPKVKAETRYRLQGLSGPATAAQGGSPVSYDVPCPDAFSVTLTPAPKDDTPHLAVRADLVGRPRPVSALATTNGVYRQAARQELQRRGLKNPVVKLIQVIRTDLDGNGSQEVIIEATHFAGAQGDFLGPPVNAAVGDYSLLLLRSVVNGKLRTAVLGADVVLKASSDPESAPRLGLRERLEGIADFNGDGRMEIVTSESYYEGTTIDAWTWTGAAGPKIVLESGCGV